eukprot:gnl/TRDRNA2_/TRDRNA2_74992_c0_seq1.p1 gnl/TRDRNA2_/TRDRNA2_74992_c0~~gnl/TRDRNA2_/TRDRNA2_74992_c0_seq1.p1  ORF type:complete len:256 (+),score=48.14 gnl/TRDRNA2_/TRDRNA2_74992_c0_seq1:60-827(+)
MSVPDGNGWESGRGPEQDDLHPEDAEGLERMLRVLEGHRFHAEIRSFTRQNCAAFACAEAEAASGGGHSHFCHEVHLQYRSLFDREVESFLRNEGIELEEFLEFVRLRAEAPAGKRAGWNAFLAELTASEDYIRFAKLMTAAAAQQRAEAEEAQNSFELPERPAECDNSQDVAAVAAAEAAAAALAADAGAAACSYYYHCTDGQQYGPGTAEDIAGCWRAGLLNRESLIFFPGLTDWVQLGQLPDLLAWLGSATF